MSRIRLLTVVAFLLAGVFLFFRLGDLPLISPDEGRNAEVAREMKDAGAWLSPTYNGYSYLDKPAFYFRTVALSFAAFGESETTARLPSAVFALLVLALLFFMSRRLYGEQCAGLVVIVAAASPLFFGFARTVIFDMPLAFFVLLSLAAVHQGLREYPRKGQRWWALGAAAAGVATLIKGPVGFLLPALIALISGWTRPVAGGRRDRSWILKRLFSPLNLFVFLGLVLPWFLGLVRLRPDFLEYGLLEESVRRYSTSAFHRTAPFYYYGPAILATFFPWSVLLPESIVLAWKSRRVWEENDRFFIVSALVIVIFFSLSQSKLPGYVLVAVIALGILIARLFSRAWVNPGGRAAQIVRRGNLILAGTGIGAGLFLLQNVIEPGRLQRVFHIASAEFDRLQPACLPLTVTFAAIALLAILAWRIRHPVASLVVFLLLPLSLLTVNFGALRSYAEAGSSRRQALALRGRLGGASADAAVAGLELFPTGLSFYLKRPLVLVSRDGHEVTSNYLLYRLRKGERRPEWLVAYEDRETWLRAQPHPVYFITGSRGKDELGRMAAARGEELCEITPGTWGVLLPPGPEGGR